MKRLKSFADYIAILSVALMAWGCKSSSPNSEGPASAKAVRGPVPVYIGTFTDKQAKGIYLTWLDMNSGTLTEPELVVEAKSPSYLAIDPTGRFLYSVNEINNWEGKKSGAVSAFSLSPDRKKLTLLNQQTSAGEGPTHISLDQTGKVALVANYGSGSAASLPISSDGKLQPPASVDQHEGKGSDPARQEGPHAHCFNAGPGNRFALSADLGLDKVFVYHLNAMDGALRPNDPPFFRVDPGSGPRHLAFHPGGRFVYVINEMASTITAFTWDGRRGTANKLQVISTLPSDFHGQNTTAEIMMHPSGRFLYGSNRGHDSIAIFSVDQQTGTLTALGHVSTQGKTPRGFGIDPTGQFLIAANQDTDNLVVYRINTQDGSLAPTGGTAHVGNPVCVTFWTAAK